VKRQRPKEQRVDHTEERRVGANPQSDDENSYDKKSGIAAQRPEGIPNTRHFFLPLGSVSVVADGSVGCRLEKRSLCKG
jgi:hypothetical protein